ncbi:hypothetical protein [Nonomuraea jiangxiensis]|uniref:Uncharacterized protein n=1 Tax=Nonomuraea jiangxiensis TaxID=633440 RepID=A0A1G8FWI6_9ACTN|nr:hypothetical protein [Nonomuraea jiangxiensis]SDH86336.1 hypothetical protein SAMN05421869_103448 [Nonomuraea jiangxiensis]
MARHAGAARAILWSRRTRNHLVAAAGSVVQEFAPKGPAREDRTLSSRVYRDPANRDPLPNDPRHAHL